MKVPRSKQNEIIETTHSHFSQGAHFGFHRTLNNIKKKYRWPTIRKDVKEKVANCLECARRKQKIMPKAPLQPIPTANYIMEVISIDVLGPMVETKKRNKYVLVVREFLTRYIWCIPMKNQTAETTVAKLTKHVFLKE